MALAIALSGSAPSSRPVGGLWERVLGASCQPVFGARARVVARVEAHEIDHRLHARETWWGRHAVRIAYVRHGAADLAARAAAPAVVIMPNARLIQRARLAVHDTASVVAR